MSNSNAFKMIQHCFTENGKKRCGSKNSTYVYLTGPGPPKYPCPGKQEPLPHFPQPLFPVAKALRDADSSASCWAA